MKLLPDANQRVVNLPLKVLCNFGLIKKKIFAELPPIFRTCLKLI